MSDDRVWFEVNVSGSRERTMFATEADARSWVDQSGIGSCTHFEILRLVAPSLAPGSPSVPSETVMASCFRHAPRCHHHPDPDRAAAEGEWRS